MELPEVRQPSVQFETEDWSGLKDAKERRRLQNRRHARNYRRRKAAESAASAVVRANNQSNLQWIAEHPHLSEERREVAVAKYGSVHPFIQILHQMYGQQHASSGRAPLAFPLSRDNLIPLVQYNVKRAGLTNAMILETCISHSDVLPILQGDCRLLEPEIVLFPGFYDAPVSQQILPPSLEPTALQRRVSHKSWIDILPDPALRDNIIREFFSGDNSPRFDMDELYSDLASLPCLSNGEARSMTDLPIIIAWETPWLPSGFEMSEAFVRKYRPLLVGCHGLQRATDTWRQLRGERPLFRRVW